MRVGSLFSGIGGLDLGLERAGMRVVWQSEVDPYACRVLAKHWPDVPNLGDVRTIEWSQVEPVDLICGGYPCQPFSLAGSRQGEDDARHLWPYFVDALRELRPRFALMENVPGHLSLGFGRVLGDLAESGYDAEWDCIPAAAVGAPHLRDRVFVVAHAHGEGEPVESVDGYPRPGVVVPHVADAKSSGRNARGHGNGAGEAGRRRAVTPLADADGSAWRGAWGSGEAVSRPRTFQRPGRRSGSFGDFWTVEPDVGRVAHGVPSRVDRLRTLGNAVVPQVAEYVGRLIMERAA